MSLDEKIEAILFWKGEPLVVSELSEAVGCGTAEIESALKELEEKLKNRGVVLTRVGDSVMLRTSPKTSELIERLAKEELSRDIGRAGLETLSIILYLGPVSRREIEYIRGVNSFVTLRSLLMRGLAEKFENPENQRSFLYKPTHDLLSFLGVVKLEDLPDFKKVKKEIIEMRSAAISDVDSEFKPKSI